MLRLGIVIVLAALLGIGGGMLQYNLSYQDIDERFADFKANTTPVVAVEKSDATANGPKQVQAEKAPKVEVPGGTTHDFGTMQQGSKKTHTFVFKNIGDAPMRLDVLGSSCRCTIGTLADSLLNPGEETGVTLEWKATGVLDEFSQTATIGTTDPEHRQVLLSVKGIVARTVLVEPPSINLGDVSVAQGAVRTAYVFGYGDIPLEVKSVTWGDEKNANMVDIKVSPMEIDPERFAHHSRAKGAAKIELFVKPGMTLGPINSRLVVDTNIENVTNVDLTVTGAIVGDLQVMGGPSFEVDKNVLNFGTVLSSEGATSNVHLSAQGDLRDTLEFEVVEVIPKDSLQVTIGKPKQQISRTLYPVTCTVPKGAPPAMFPGTSSKNFGKVVIKTNHPSIPEVRINFRIIVE
ncbi:MAG: DUF1573 domain-containing protein [Pirellulaceae bacterium]|nr:DUF1573 domain-containing protein [Pirellulaceae bacterium]